MDPSPVLASHDGCSMSSKIVNVEKHRIAPEDARSQSSVDEMFDEAAPDFEHSVDHVSPRKRFGDIRWI